MIELIGLIFAFLLGFGIGVYITIDKYQSVLSGVRSELKSIKMGVKHD